MFFRSKRVYLDYAAATPVRKEIKKAIQAYFDVDFANPSAIHKEGVRARRAVEKARLAVARSVGARPEDVIFTASGTESNNLALFGVCESVNQSGVAYDDMEIITTAIEHPSVSAVIEILKAKGVTVKYLPLDETGQVIVSEIKSLLTPKTILVTVAYVNSEIGVVQPISAISRVIKAFEKDYSNKIVFHVDGAQAPLWLSCHINSLKSDLLSLDAGKCYGPKGVGILIKRHGVDVSPYIYGGGQENNIRSGTENTPLIVGASLALVEAQQNYQARADRVSLLRDGLIEKLLKIEGVVLNGSPEKRVANNVNVSVAGVPSEFAVVSLDEAGFAIATKSACSGATGGGSAVIRHIYNDDLRAETTLRITLGEETTKRELDNFFDALKKHIEETRVSHSFLTKS
ncbi:cysteine desulfurase [Candidatus Kaiserbacteria bacterium]|nr:cysteine desulfurase [Candidatus Kaiserbacteria bacterium]